MFRCVGKVCVLNAIHKLPHTEFVPTVKSLLGNPVYIIYLCVTIIQFNSLIGMVTYKPKYIEQHYGQSASKANFLMGKQDILMIHNVYLVWKIFSCHFIFVDELFKTCVASPKGKYLMMQNDVSWTVIISVS